MKKVILLMMVAILGVASANAQFEKGVKRIQAQTSAFDLNFGKEDIHLNLGLEGSYFVADKVAVNANIGFDWTKVKGVDANSLFGFGVGADYYFYKIIYGGVGLDFSKQKGIDFESTIKLEVGATHYIAENVYVNPDIYLRTGIAGDATVRFGIELGIGVNF